MNATKPKTFEEFQSETRKCFDYDHALKSVVFIASGETLLLSRENVKTVINELKKHYEGMAP